MSQNRLITLVLHTRNMCVHVQVIQMLTDRADILTQDCCSLAPDPVNFFEPSRQVGCLRIA
jgi:hypothetical protein